MQYTDSFTHYLDKRLYDVISAPTANDILKIEQELELQSASLDETIPSAVKLFVRGFFSLKSGQLKQSIILLTDAIHKAKASPSHTLKYYIDYGMGIALVRAGNFVEAIASLTKAADCKFIDNVPLSSRVYANLGFIFLETHDYYKAHYYCELAWETGGQLQCTARSPMLTNLAFSNTLLGRFDTAEKQFLLYKAELDRNPNALGRFFYHNAYGSHLERTGNVEQALQSYKLAIASGETLNDNIYLLNVLKEYCRCATEQQQFSEIHFYLEKAIKLVHVYGGATLLQEFADITQVVSQQIADPTSRCTMLTQAFELQSKALQIQSESHNESISQLYQLHSERPQLENAQSLAKNLELISSFGEYLGTHSDLTDMVFRLNKDLEKLMSVDCLALGLFDENTQTLHYDQFIDLGQLLAPFSIDCTREATLSTYCINNKTSFVHGRFSAGVLEKLINGDPTAHAFVGSTEEDYPSIIMVPLILDDKVLGILTVQTHQQHAYQEYHVSLIKHLCSYIAIDIQNKQQKKQLEKQKKALNTLANHDPLTGLFNRVSLSSSIKRLKQCEQVGNELAVLLIDIDYYKQFNDHYGHIKGDEVLVEVATLLKQHFSSDTCKVFRYGGDEFLILTECLTQSDIELKTRELQKEMHEHHIEHLSSLCSDRLTLSIGGAMFNANNRNTITDSELIQRADEALYVVKDQGRNGVVIKCASSLVEPHKGHDVVTFM